MVTESIDSILKYFDLSDLQISKLEQLVQTHITLAGKINLLSAGDIDHIWVRHILHSLMIAKVGRIGPGTAVLDIGTGGGFPTVPLAILYPESTFHCIDGRTKKIRAVRQIVADLNITNVHPMAVRAEQLQEKYGVILARAVAPLDRLIKWSKRLTVEDARLYFFKGGDFEKEQRRVRANVQYQIHRISESLSEPYFADKYVLEVVFD